MLLRRITQHVKAQNWFAVVIDFTIVVFGILLAFQITEWNQARKDRILEREYLERVVQDLEGDAKALELSIRLAISRAEKLDLVLNLRNDAKAAVDNQCAYLIGVAMGSVASLRPSLNQTHGEMVTSGNLSLLRSNTIKNQLGIYYNNYQALNNSMQRIGQRVAPLAVIQRNHLPTALGQAMTYEANKLNTVTVVDVIIEQTVDLSKLSICTAYTDEFLTFYTSINKDPEFFGLLQGAESIQLYMAKTMSNLLASNQSLKALIASELEK